MNRRKEGLHGAGSGFWLVPYAPNEHIRTQRDLVKPCKKASHIILYRLAATFGKIKTRHDGIDLRACPISNANPDAATLTDPCLCRIPRHFFSARESTGGRPNPANEPITSAMLFVV